MSDIIVKKEDKKKVIIFKTSPLAYIPLAILIIVLLVTIISKLLSYFWR